jgi:hypothetical protein
MRIYVCTHPPTHPPTHKHIPSARHTYTHKYFTASSKIMACDIQRMHTHTHTHTLSLSLSLCLTHTLLYIHTHWLIHTQISQPPTGAWLVTPRESPDSQSPTQELRATARKDEISRQVHMKTLSMRGASPYRNNPHYRSAVQGGYVFKHAVHAKWFFTYECAYIHTETRLFIIYVHMHTRMEVFTST